MKLTRRQKYKGYAFKSLGDNFNKFYSEYLPFELTKAQKNVLKEIWNDVQKPEQMNRLLQGDVGSGKTLVALFSMLMAIDNQYQTCIMAPTEILAQQHFHSISKYLSQMDINVAILTGSTKTKDRKLLQSDLENGEINILIHNKDSSLLNGIKLDYKDTLMGGGFQIENPSADRECGCGQSFG